VTWNLRSLLILALVAVASAATAILAQNAVTEKPTVYGEFVKVGGTYIRASRIDRVFRLSDGRVCLTFGEQSGYYTVEESAGALRVLGLPAFENRKLER
jgi:hypothetical protein